MHLNRIAPLFLLLAGLSSFSLPFGPPKTGIFTDCRQLVVVVSSHDTNVVAELRYYEKVGKTWQEQNQPFPVNFGKKGLAWGRGLHSKKAGQQKKEGDQKSPAGIFRFGTAFGYAAKPDMPLKLDYIPIDETLICVEDDHSRYYNQIVDEKDVKKDWKGKEYMMRKDPQYKWGIFVKHNVPPKREGGSCIFFHIWRGPGMGTLGCTAMAEENLVPLLGWLDPQKKPLLLQMTEQDYRTYQKKFALPEW